MENFIQEQLSVVLQPFVNHIQRIDLRLNELQVQYDMSNTGLHNIRKQQTEFDSKVRNLSGSLTRTDDNVACLRTEADRLSEKTGQLRCDHEATDALAKCAKEQAELLLNRQDYEEVKSCELFKDFRSEIKNHLQHFTKDIRGKQQAQADQLQQVHMRGDIFAGDLIRLRAQGTEAIEGLGEVRSLSNQNHSQLSLLTGRVEELEAEARRNGRDVDTLKEQHAHEEPLLQRLLGDTARMQEREDQHDALIKALQEETGDQRSQQESFGHTLTQTIHDVEVLNRGLDAAKAGLDDAHRGLSQTNSEVSSLGQGQSKAQQELAEQGQRIRDLSSEHQVLKQEVDLALSAGAEQEEEQISTEEAIAQAVAKAVGQVQEQHQQQEEEKKRERDQIASKGDLVRLRKEMEKLIEGQDGVKGHIHAIDTRVGKVEVLQEDQAEAIDRLQQSSELCQANLKGLQSGFMSHSGHVGSSALEATLSKHDLIRMEAASTLPTSPGAADAFDQPLESATSAVDAAQQLPPVPSAPGAAERLRNRQEAPEQTSNDAEVSHSTCQVMCPAGHKLQEISTPADGWSCSGCQKVSHCGDLLFGCRLCDYDLCRRCLSRPKKAPTQSLRQPRPEPTQSRPESADSMGWSRQISNDERVAECPQHHRLEAVGTERLGWHCTVCGEIFEDGEQLRSCSFCEHELCRTCTGRAEEAAGAPLKVSVLQAQGLQDSSTWPSGGKSDLYCICFLHKPQGKSVEQFRTAAVSGSASPVWSHLSQAIPGWEEGDDLEFQVWDQQDSSVDAFLGKANLESAAFTPEGLTGELNVLDSAKGITATLSVQVSIVARLAAACQPGSRQQPRRSKSQVSDPLAGSALNPPPIAE